MIERMPERLTAPCVARPYKGTTNGELLEHALHLVEVIRECDSRMRTMREASR